MSTLRVAGGFGFFLMVAAIAHGLLHGDFRTEGWWLLSHPWGRVSLIDLYVGFAVVSSWIAWRERSPWRSAPWILAVLLLGNLATCVYLLQAARHAGGDVRALLLGPRRT